MRRLQRHSLHGAPVHERGHCRCSNELSIHSAHCVALGMRALSRVFGTNDELLVPDVPTVLGYVEPVSNEGGHIEPAAAIRTKSTAFEHAIAFESRRTCHLEEDEQMQLLAQKWEALISIDYHAFDLGLDTVVLP